MQNTIVKEAIKYGIIAGLIEAIIMYGSWAAGLDTYVSVAGIANFVPYMIVLFLVAGFQLRKNLGGYLSFQEALKFTFLAYVIAVAIEAVSTYILFSVIDPDLTSKVFAVTKEKMLKMMQKMGTPQSAIDDAARDMDAKQQTGMKNIFLGMGFSLIMGFFKALLISLVIKKDRKVDENFLA